MTLRDIYADVYSRVSAIKQESELFYMDYVRAINDAIATTRAEYIANGMGAHISTKQTFYFAIPDLEFPYVNSTPMSKPAIKEIPFSTAVITAVGYSHRTLSRALMSYSTDTEVQRAGRKVTTDWPINAQNTYALTYDPRELRNYKPGNALSYKAGEVILDVTDGFVYRVGVDFASDASEAPLSANPDFTRLYWRDSGPAVMFPSYKRYDQIEDFVLYSGLTKGFAITSKGNKLYVSTNIQMLVLDYVTEWEDVVNLDDTVDIPRMMVTVVTAKAIAQLQSKLVGNEQQRISS